MGLGASNGDSHNFNTLEMTNYKIEKQIRQMLEKFQQSDFTKKEPRRVIAEVIASKLKKYFKKDNE